MSRLKHPYRTGRVLPLVLALCAVAVVAPAAHAVTYTWNVAAGAWTDPASWAPARLAPEVTDVLIFDGNVTPVASATGIQPEVFGQLHVIGGAQASLAYSFGLTVGMTIVGDAGVDLLVASGSVLTMTGDGSGGLQVTMPTGTTGSVAGELRMMQGNQRLLPASAGSVSFETGSVCRLTTGFVGNPFGATGTNGVVHFQNGSSMLQGAGVSPFGNAGVTRVVYQTGSLYKVTAAAAGLFANRTFSHLELDVAAVFIGTLTLTADDMTFTQGGFRNTGVAATLTVRGNLTIGSAGSLELLAPSGTATLLMSGTVPQTISGTGLLTLNAFSGLSVTNPAGLTLGRSIFTDGSVNLTGSGKIHTGSNLLHLGLQAALTAGSDSWVTGRLGKMFAAGPGGFLFEVGDATRKATVDGFFNSVADSGTLIVTTAAGDHPTLFNIGLDPAQSVNRTWSVSNAGVAFSTCDLMFNFENPADVDAGADPLQFVVGKNDGGVWSLPGVGIRTAASIQALGLTSFSDFAVAEVALGSDQIQAQPGPGACISTATPCVAVPVVWDRTATTPARGYSVTVQLSPNLTLCGAQFASGGYLLPGAGGTSFLVTPIGFKQYTIDEVTLGDPCGATGDGTLFTLHVTSGDPGGVGSITVLSTTARDCSNQALPANPGAVAIVPIDNQAPSEVVLSATQRKAGNGQPPNGTTDVLVSWTGQELGSTVAVYRKGFGGYPQYDENGGVTPTAPATPAAALGAGWTLTGVTTSGGADRMGARDFYYYVAFTTDGCGNVSAVSNQTGGTLNYHLGDVHDGLANCAGNDLVSTQDVSFMGASYGTTIAVNGPLECLDVGPTTDFSVDARPSTDNKVNFEDLVVLAINFGTVSMPQAKAVPMAAAMNALELGMPTLPGAGETFAVTLDLAGAANIQGLSAQLGYDHDAVEFLGVEPGELLARQAAPGVVLSAGAGNVDVALLGAGAGLRGRGAIARALFRVRRTGGAAITLESVDARDAANQPVTLAGASAPVSTAAPSATALAPARPTPFRDRTVLEYALARTGVVELAIYSVDGRRIATLERGERAAGVYRVAWDGRDKSGASAPAGMYFARLVTSEGKLSRTLIRVR